MIEHVAMQKMSFDPDGAELFQGAAKDILATLAAALADVAPDRAGVRIHARATLRPWLGPNGILGALVSAALKAQSRPVRAILFDKTPQTNWSLAWHQDRTICVKHRLDVAGFGPWTVKQGLLHVAPPFEWLKRMATMRVHLDDVPADNAPLLVAPGSHRLGLVTSDQIGEKVRACGVRACLARVGDVWLYATPILHASEAAKSAGRRRVLQIDFAPFELPGGLEWLGV